MTVRCRTAGVTVSVDSRDPHWLALAAEACAGRALGAGPSEVDVVVEPAGAPDLDGLRVVTRGALAGDERVVLADACGSGLDLELALSGGRLRVRAWPRPTWRHRGLGALAPERRVLLHRAALIQYPALWWAGLSGLAPLHVCAATVSGTAVLLAGPGGVGKSTLLGTLGAGDVAVSDNLCAGDASRVHALVEPIRDEQGEGRRMPHGRRERAWTDPADSLAPERVIVLRRGTGNDLVVNPVPPGLAARELVAGTYAAGELRRYWAFAATVALGLGRGPAHPPVAAVAGAITDAVPCTIVELPSVPGTTLAEIVQRAAQADGGRLTAQNGQVR
ncbi:MAG TPA: hypothetical protein VFM07_06965 [Intrasporangium sp.]|nr:hypothetical protein [Intrasporangium sp.]